MKPEQRSRVMASIIRGKHTKPEMAVRRYLHHLGLRYGLHARDLPLDPVLDKSSVWTDGEIKKRSELLANVAYKKIRKF